MGGNQPSAAGWIDVSLALLARTRSGDGGWPYHAGGDSAAEPTATVVAALWALQQNDDGRRSGLSFLESLHGEKGGLTAQPGPSAPVALAALGAIALARCGGSRAVAGRIADTLFGWPVRRIENEDRSVYGFDPSLGGLPWTPDTFSWVEPTAYGVILCESLGRGGHPRVAEARRLLVDRAHVGGGWNYGNPVVFETALEPDPLPTAWALLALRDDPSRSAVRQGAGYLRSVMPRLGSPLTRAWARVALGAIGDRTAASAVGSDAESFGDLLRRGRLAPTSPWHHAAALLSVAPLERNAFVFGRTG